MARFDGLTIWTDAFLGDTLDLSNEEVGVYFLLLMAAWRTPTCDLPDDDKSLARFSRCSPRRWIDHMRPVMLRFWRVSDGRWSQGRLKREREATENRAAKAVQASLSRWGQNKSRRSRKTTIKSATH